MAFPLIVLSALLVLFALLALILYIIMYARSVHFFCLFKNVKTEIVLKISYCVYSVFFD